MNPQMAGMSDAQIEQAAAQMEQMAENPGMMQMAAQQMKNMSPDQITQMQNMAKNMNPAEMQKMQKMAKDMGMSPGGGGGGGMPDMAGMDPANMDMSKAADMMKNMDPENLKSMMKMQREMMKNNPEMFEKMMGSNPMMKGMDKDQLEKQMDMMENMDPKQLKSMMAMAQGVQKYTAPLQNAYAWLNNATGGRAVSVLVAVGAISMCYVVDYFFF